MTTANTNSGPTGRLQANHVDGALLIVRLALAAVFLYHGSAILFGAFGGPGLKGFVGFTHMPMAVAFLVGLAQFGGGLAMLTGVLARLGAAGISIVMLGAIFLVHIHKGFEVQKGGYEFALVMFLTAVAILISGAGRYTLVALLPGYGSPGKSGADTDDRPVLKAA